MAKDNLKKTEKKQDQNYHSMKAYKPWRLLSTKIETPLFRQKTTWNSKFYYS